MRACCDDRAITPVSGEVEGNVAGIPASTIATEGDAAGGGTSASTTSTDGLSRNTNGLITSSRNRSGAVDRDGCRITVGKVGGAKC